MKIIITLSIIAAIVAMIILLKVVFVLRDKANEKGVATFVWSFDIDLKFWALLPAFNLNRNSIEVEFLCFALYLNITDYSGNKPDEKKTVTGHIPFIVDKEKDVIIGDGVILNDPMNDVVEFANRYFGVNKKPYTNNSFNYDIIKADSFLKSFFEKHFDELEVLKISEKILSLDFESIMILLHVCRYGSVGIRLTRIIKLMPLLSPRSASLKTELLLDMGLIRRERTNDAVLIFPYIG